MSEFEDLPKRVSNAIPYFFYDLFGRILPGLFLISGLLIASRHNSNVRVFMKFAAQAGTIEWVVGFMLFGAGCFVVGFLLSVLPRPLFRYLSSPITLTELRDVFGQSAEEESMLETAFEAMFGFGLDHASKTKAYLFYCSRLCEFAVQSRSYALDSVSVRISAEELLGRSLFVASVILFFVHVLLFKWVASIEYWWIAPAVYATIAATSLSAFHYYRKKGIRERFQMFLVMARVDRFVARKEGES